ncbi:MAG: recombinase family protein [Actinobacteria bacterium]|nr:recombinase family protein [Actinomycetota bacterium]
MRPKVFGYIRSSRLDPVKVVRLTHELEEYADREGLALAYVFTDNGVSSTALVRPGFSVLLDSLSHPSAYGLVIPAVYHLSWRPAVRATLEQQIRETGAVLYVMPAATRLPERHCAEGAGGGGPQIV